jgi:ferredoxin
VRVIVDRDKCCGAGQCVIVAPDTFDQQEDDGIVVLLEEEPPPERHDVVRQAVRLCPGLAIAVTED